MFLPSKSAKHLCNQDYKSCYSCIIQVIIYRYLHIIIRIIMYNNFQVVDLVYIYNIDKYKFTQMVA